MKYFSDTEKGSRPRIESEIPYNFWCGLVSYTQSLMDKGWFSNSFPEMCPDGRGCCGTNESRLSSGLRAEIPEIEWPLQTENDEDPDSWTSSKVPFTPYYLHVLDLIQFLYANVSEPELGDYHSYYGHYHYTSFNVSKGQAVYFEKVNTLFARNGLAYELLEGGQIIRVLNESMTSIIAQSSNTIDTELNELLVKASGRITHPDVHIRYDALKDLWDGYERVKTLYDPSKTKKHSMSQLLDSVSSDPDFRAQIESEARALTSIGNAFFIRHSEVDQIKLSDSDHIEYLFHRLASFLYLLSKKLK